MSNLDQLLDELLALLNRDKKALKRLVLSAMDRHPGQRASWYLEKVIWDIRRDRSL